MKKLQEVGGDSLEFSGYGGEHMRRAGFTATMDFDIDMLADKTFVTYRKGRNMNENSNNKWNPFNMVNRHFIRQTN